MHHKSTTSAMRDNLEMLSDHAAEKTDTVFICHSTNPFQHPSIKDELETDQNRIRQQQPCMPSRAICTLRAEVRYEE